MLDKIKLYGTATMGSKGQIVIPSEARDKLDLQEGEKLIVVQGPHPQSLIIIKTEVLQNTLKHLTSLGSNLETINEQLQNESLAEETE